MSWRRRSLLVAGSAVATLAICGWMIWTVGVVERHELYEAGHNYRGVFFNRSQVPVALGFFLFCAFGAGAYAWWYRRRERREIKQPRKDP